jgi:cell division protein FtsB
MTTNAGKRTRGPRGSTGPGQSAGRSRTSAARLVRAPESPVGAAPAGGPGPVRATSRWTSRAAVLTLVVAVLLVSYASSLRAFLVQRAHINQVQTEIARTQAQIEALEDEKAKWEDPAYVEQQARQRLGYVLPGERTYLVLDEDGQPLRPASNLDDPDDVLSTTPTAWWSQAWESVELAGDPPRVTPPPETRIDGAAENSEKP